MSATKINDKPFLGTREQAFVYALASASLTQAVAKTCSSGYSKKCSCYRETGRDISPSDFKWGGCGDDVRFASSFAQTFTDQIWQKNKDKSKKSIVNLHNNKLGRKVGTVETNLFGDLLLE